MSNNEYQPNSQLSQYYVIEEVPSDDLTYKDLKFAPNGLERNKARFKIQQERHAEQHEALKQKFNSNLSRAPER